MVGNKVGNEVVRDQTILTEKRLTILSEMRNNPNTTKAQLTIVLGISDTAVDKNIDYLKKNGFIQRVGSTKGGYWKVLDKK